MRTIYYIYRSFYSWVYTFYYFFLLLGNKKISFEELLRFIYRIWKSQLDELADRLTVLDERVVGEMKLLMVKVSVFIG